VEKGRRYVSLTIVSEDVVIAALSAAELSAFGIEVGGGSALALLFLGLLARF
jgi:hypothetical protein